MAIGNALLDTLVTIPDDGFLPGSGLTKGHMTLVDSTASQNIMERAAGFSVHDSPGGSAANTVRGIAGLGMPCGYIGKVGHDPCGDLYQSDLEKNRIQSILLRGELPTGRCISLISPDCERTMATYLGSAVDLCADDIDASYLNGYDYLHLEGYLVQNRMLIKKAMEAGKEKGLCVSLDLASPNVVAGHLPFLQGLTSQYVDIIFANEEEAMVFTDTLDPREALFVLSTFCKIAVIKLGSKGSMISYQHSRFIIEPFRAEAVDATGAGDMYAAGFLYGMARGYGLETCGQIASYMGSRTVQIMGSSFSVRDWKEIRSDVRRLSRS